MDNPEAPDYVAEFYERYEKYREREKEVKGNQDFVHFYAELEEQLSGEMGWALERLNKALSKQAQASLAEAQQQWQRHVEAESDFIEKNWTAAEFGSSAVVSRGSYRVALLRSRVELLLSYLKSY